MGAGTFDLTTANIEKSPTDKATSYFKEKIPKERKNPINPATYSSEKERSMPK